MVPVGGHSNLSFSLDGGGIANINRFYRSENAACSHLPAISIGKKSVETAICPSKYVGRLKEYWLTNRQKIASHEFCRFSVHVRAQRSTWNSSLIEESALSIGMSSCSTIATIQATPRIVAKRRTLIERSSVFYSLDSSIYFSTPHLRYALIPACICICICDPTRVDLDRRVSFDPTKSDFLRVRCPTN